MNCLVAELGRSSHQRAGSNLVQLVYAKRQSQKVIAHRYILARRFGSYVLNRTICFVYLKLVWNGLL